MSVIYLKAAAVFVVGVGAQPLVAQVNAYSAEHALEAAAVGLRVAEGSLSAAVSMLETKQARLWALAPSIAAAKPSWSTYATGLAAMRYVLAFPALTVARGSNEWFPQDTADAVYRRARTAFNGRNYREAIELFGALRNQYPQSRYVPQAMYYEAFALSRLETEASYRTALTVLDQYRSRFPRESSSDVEQLYIRIQGQLARRGDSEAAAAVAARAAELAPGPVIVGAATRGAQSRAEDDVRMQALNALMQMNAENAMPILRDVLANKDPDRVHLRRRAVFLVAQKRTAGREEILLEAARNDPDLEVREQAVQWLSQVRTDRAVAALDSILQTAAERSLREKAIFALSQHRSERAGEILRAYALRRDADIELRSYAIQWLGQSRGNSEFLRHLFPQLEHGDLKERALFALSQRRTEENAQFLFGIAMDESEDIRIRTRALFWMGQMRGVNQDLYTLYDRVDNRDMKKQLIAVYGQRRRDSLAVDQLITIARNEQDTELRGKAIFWLGQSRDPRAIEVLREIINR